VCDIFCIVCHSLASAVMVDVCVSMMDKVFPPLGGIIASACYYYVFSYLSPSRRRQCHVVLYLVAKNEACHKFSNSSTFDPFFSPSQLHQTSFLVVCICPHTFPHISSFLIPSPFLNNALHILGPLTPQIWRGKGPFAIQSTTIPRRTNLSVLSRNTLFWTRIACVL
jgi:hypothetical protein